MLVSVEHKVAESYKPSFGARDCAFCRPLRVLAPVEGVHAVFYGRDDRLQLLSGRPGPSENLLEQFHIGATLTGSAQAANQAGARIVSLLRRPSLPGRLPLNHGAIWKLARGFFGHGNLLSTLNP